MIKSTLAGILVLGFGWISVAHAAPSEDEIKKKCGWSSISSAESMIKTYQNTIVDLKKRNPKNDPNKQDCIDIQDELYGFIAPKTCARSRSLIEDCNRAMDMWQKDLANSRQSYDQCATKLKTASPPAPVAPTKQPPSGGGRRLPGFL